MFSTVCNTKKQRYIKFSLCYTVLNTKVVFLKKAQNTLFPKKAWKGIKPQKTVHQPNV